MDLNYLRKLVKIFDDSAATELTIEEEGATISLSKNNKENSQQTAQMISLPPQFVAGASPQAGQTLPPPQTDESAASDAASDEDKYHAISSPIVGTFYRAPSPDSEPFVEVGSTVSSGETLCIVEAMKLMNEIESDVSGKIVKILVQNAQPVEYGQKLFLIESA